MENGRAAPSQLSANNLGLCADCAHAQIIRSDKGSAFLQCQLSFTDSRFVKYPRLPVLTCSGYEKRPGLAPRT